MFSHRVIVSLACLALPCVGGCVTFWSVKPVVATVRNAETGQPIPSATVEVDYQNDASILSKSNEKQITDASGKATIAVGARTGGVKVAPQWHVEAEGYLAATFDGHVGEHIPAELRVPGRDDSADIRLYPNPAPTVTVLVGDKYRGPICLHIRRTDEWIQESVGLREFVLKPDGDGQIDVPATPLLSRTLCAPAGFTAIRFQLRNGRELEKDWATVPSLSSSRAAPDLVCARLISQDWRWAKGKWDGTVYHYVVGTAADARIVTAGH